jgi:hypothetical protein
LPLRLCLPGKDTASDPIAEHVITVSIDESVEIQAVSVN